MALLGVPAGNLHFIGLPDGRLSAERRQLEAALAELLDTVRPRTVIAPFRHDQHPDHLAMHRAAVRLLRERPDIRLLQYFVYYRYPLLAEHDIRCVVAPQLCVAVDATPVRALKRRALDCYRSQVQLYYPWQTRPILVPPILDDHCAGTEQFVTAPADLADRELFRVDSLRLRLNLRYGPLAVRWKKRLLG
jgi:LmbE family N-acetylglucosaminyl deacetylase